MGLVFVLLSSAGCSSSAPPDNRPTGNEVPDNNLDIAPGAEALLTIPDVEQVSGISGLQLVPWDPSIGAGGDLNFAYSKDGKTVLVLMAQLRTQGFLQVWKEYTKVDDEDIAGLGEAAFKGPLMGGHRYCIFVQDGGSALSLSSF